ncbi:hypothetical protein AJ85_03880 [Alkalihalobacillus alcalophilus ATCC 27647 = CGMCC 1.3604]|uniref:Uncharacterized protein n=1 Tax=Alkalihalobacillus alcalophilus ATCC 27647 = CGMCC 1.3604 TaxID=1218173 RepID=A0A4S4K302_ALKAL|nr:hypothetical protein AJ85_03880 [Alkalihalobacillus alcalophilus ATCC 27647 = CGMCC 1.3604]
MVVVTKKSLMGKRLVDIWISGFIMNIYSFIKRGGFNA